MALTLISCHKTQPSGGLSLKSALQKGEEKNEITSRQCNKFKLIEFQSKHNLSQQPANRQEATLLPLKASRAEQSTPHAGELMMELTREVSSRTTT